MRRPPLTSVRLVASVPSVERDPLPGLAQLAREHPSIAVLRAGDADAGGRDEPVIDDVAWLGSSGFTMFDDAVTRSGSASITVRGAPGAVARVAVEVLTRCQRFIDRRNEASSAARFDEVLRVHAALHDVSKPLVKADLDHAIDTWQWMLRLDAAASLEAQLAALFHDIERLESEAERRVEQHAPDYAAFKDRHAARGGERAEQLLREVQLEPRTAARVREIITAHERRGRDPEVDLLNDADALSFFSLNSAGYADYFGPEQTRKKVEYTLRRLAPRARARLARVRLRPDIGAHVRALGPA